MNQNDKKIKNEKGVVMLLALLLMAAMTATGVGLSILIMGELKSSSNIDHSIVAFYAAESGIENGLLVTRQHRTTDTLSNTILAIKTYNNVIMPGSGANWTTNNSGTTSSEDIILASLPKNKTIELDLFNPDATGAGTGGGVKSVKFNWLDSCQGKSWLEVGYVYWIPGDSKWSEDKQAVYKNAYPCKTTPDPTFINRKCDEWPADYFDPAKAYKLRVKALYCDAENLDIAVYNTSGTQIPIPSRVLIKSVGTYGKSQIALTVSAPWFSSILGIFDYAIFSEKDLDKPR